MSDCVGSNCSHSCRDAPLDSKPKYVRRLNFGQSILELDVVEECYASNHVLIIDQNVAHIPCTEKKDYVRKWIETHENDEHDVISSDDSSQSSPILGTSATKVSKTSPIFKNSRKRPRGKIRINRHVKVKKVSGVNCQEDTKRIINCAIKCKLDCESKQKNKNKQENFSKSQCTLPCTEKIVTDEMSPTIGSKSLKLHDNKRRPRINSVISDKNCSVLKGISIDDKLKKNVNINHVATTLFSNETKNPEIHQKHKGPFSSIAQEKLRFEYDSTDSTDKDNLNIEISTSDDSKDEKCDKLSSTRSSNNNLSNLIEEIDTQEDTQQSQFSVSDKSLTPVKQPFMTLQLAADDDDDSDETYCSEVETMQNQSIRLSAKISEVASLDKITQKTGSRSTQTDAIINTPSKKSPDQSMYAHLLNSEKKCRKPKK